MSCMKLTTTKVQPMGHLFHDVSGKTSYLKDLWPLVQWAFASGLRENYSIHMRHWDYIRLNDGDVHAVHSSSTKASRVSNVLTNALRTEASRSPSARKY